MKQLQVKGLTKRYGKKEVLRGIDLTLQEGKIYGLLGRNGAGKTTLLSILAAQNTHNSGTVTLDGQTVWENRAALNNICFSRELSATGMFGQNTFKIQDYFDASRAFMPNWDDAYAKQLIELFHLNPKDKIAKLSKGMMSMVTIVLALASKAAFTLLDEPVAGLDIVAREDFYRLLLEEYAKTGRTFVVSTHIVEEAESIFEDVIMIDNGKIIEDGNTEELVGQFYSIAGHEDTVAQATAGMKTMHKSTMGRMTTLVVRGGEDVAQKLAGFDVTVSPMSLSKVFVALTGKEI